MSTCRPVHLSPCRWTSSVNHRPHGHCSPARTATSLPATLPGVLVNSCGVLVTLPGVPVNSRGVLVTLPGVPVASCAVPATLPSVSITSAGVPADSLGYFARVLATLAGVLVTSPSVPANTPYVPSVRNEWRNLVLWWAPGGHWRRHHLAPTPTWPGADPTPRHSAEHGTQALQAWIRILNLVQDCGRVLRSTF